MNKEDVVCMYNGILLSHKQDGITLFAGIWMQPEMIILREVRQTEKDAYHMTLLTLKHDTSKCICKIEPDSQRHKNRLVVTKWGREGRRGSLGLADASSCIQDG